MPSSLNGAGAVIQDPLFSRRIRDSGSKTLILGRRKRQFRLAIEDRFHRVRRRDAEPPNAAFVRYAWTDRAPRTWSAGAARGIRCAVPGLMSYGLRGRPAGETLGPEGRKQAGLGAGSHPRPITQTRYRRRSCGRRSYGMMCSDRLRLAMELLGDISQGELLRANGVSTTTISLFLSGKRHLRPALVSKLMVGLERVFFERCGGRAKRLRNPSFAESRYVAASFGSKERPHSGHRGVGKPRSEYAQCIQIAVSGRLLASESILHFRLRGAEPPRSTATAHLQRAAVRAREDRGRLCDALA
jgi:hypothetical protein